MTGIWIVVGVFVAGLGAAVLHELTHYGVARLAGREAWVKWRELNCYHCLPLSGPTFADYLVGAAPFVGGASAAVGWLLLGLEITIPVVVAWGVYTLNGIPNDFRLDPGEAPETEVDAEAFFEDNTQP